MQKMVPFGGFNALNAVTILQTFSMQKKDTEDSTFNMLQNLTDIIETYKRILKKQLSIDITLAFIHSNIII